MRCQWTLITHLCRGGDELLTMKTSLTKKPMKPMTMKPRAVCKQILLNSAKQKRCTIEFSDAQGPRNNDSFSLQGKISHAGTEIARCRR